MKEKKSQLLVLLHGYGGRSGNFIFIRDYLRSSIPNLEILMLDAPFACNKFQSGFQWFELYSDDKKKQLLDIQESLKGIKEFIEDASEKHKIPYEKILVGGFSQGGMMALQTVTEIKKKLKGIIVFQVRFS